MSLRRSEIRNDHKHRIECLIIIAIHNPGVRKPWGFLNGILGFRGEIVIVLSSLMLSNVTDSFTT